MLKQILKVGIATIISLSSITPSHALFIESEDVHEGLEQKYHYVVINIKEELADPEISKELITKIIKNYIAEQDTIYAQTSDDVSLYLTKFESFYLAVCFIVKSDKIYVLTVARQHFYPQGKEYFKNFTEENPFKGVK